MTHLFKTIYSSSCLVGMVACVSMIAKLEFNYVWIEQTKTLVLFIIAESLALTGLLAEKHITDSLRDDRHG